MDPDSSSVWQLNSSTNTAIQQSAATCQSAYKQHHSTETAITSVHNYIACAVDDGDICLQVLLDRSAAFDTVDHDILLDIFDRRFGVQSNALDWFSRSHIVCMRVSE